MRCVKARLAAPRAASSLLLVGGRLLPQPQLDNAKDNGDLQALVSSGDTWSTS